MAVWPGRPDEVRDWELEIAAWVDANDACRRDLLKLLRGDGPLPTSALPDTCEVPWRSSGWNNNQNVKRLLVQMVERGEVATAGREGREQLWDLAERIYPDDPVPDVDEARLIRDERRLRALGHRPGQGHRSCPLEPVDVGEAGEPAVVEGVTGQWRVDPAQLGQPFSRPGRAAVAVRPAGRTTASGMTELFEFDYILEMYKPAAKRRSGATTPYRSCTATGWSGSSTPRPTARKESCASPPSTRTCRSRRPSPLPSTARSRISPAGSSWSSPSPRTEPGRQPPGCPWSATPAPVAQRSRGAGDAVDLRAQSQRGEEPPARRPRSSPRRAPAAPVQDDECDHQEQQRHREPDELVPERRVVPR